MIPVRTVSRVATAPAAPGVLVPLNAYTIKLFFLYLPVFLFGWLIFRIPFYLRAWVRRIADDVEENRIAEVLRDERRREAQEMGAGPGQLSVAAEDLERSGALSRVPESPKGSVALCDPSRSVGRRVGRHARR